MGAFQYFLVCQLTWKFISKVKRIFFEKQLWTYIFHSVVVNSTELLGQNVSSDSEIDWDQTPKGNIESGVCRLLLNGWVDIFNIKDEHNTNLKFMVLMDGIDKAEWKCST